MIIFQDADKDLRHPPSILSVVIVPQLSPVWTLAIAVAHQHSNANTPASGDSQLFILSSDTFLL